MITLLKLLPDKWEKAKGFLRLDLDRIEAVLNQRWAVTFGDDNLLESSTIAGDFSTDSRYISNQGPGHAMKWDQINLANGVSNTLKVTNGGTGTGTAFTLGSVVFAGAAGVYLQDNANFFWDDTNNRLGLGTPTPSERLDVNGNVRVFDQTAVTGVTVVTLIGGAGQSTTSIFSVQDHLSATERAKFQEFGRLTINLDNTLADADFAGGVSIIRGLADGVTKFVCFNDGVWNLLGRAILDLQGTDNSIGASNNGSLIKFSGDNVQLLPFNGNSSGHVGINVTSYPAVGSKGLIFADGIALASLASNTAAFYAEDVAGTVKMFAIDEDGVTGEVAKLSGPLSTGSVVFKGSAGLLTEDAGLTYDPATNNLTVVGDVTANEFFLTSGVYLMRSTVNMANGAAAAVGTLNNAPAAGDPTKWLKFDDNGTLRYIPAW
jgi:hypothetical protein